MTIWTRQFWLNAAEQAVTGAALGIGFSMPDPHHPDWLFTLSCAGAGFVAMGAKSVASNRFGAQRATPLFTAVQPKTGHGWDPVGTNPVGD